jgi:hypothetical protein
MKNIHLIPTEKPSRLISSGKEFNLLKNLTTDKRCKNIYITSDEEIKEGNWIFNGERQPSILQCIGKGSLRDWKKIILTTDQDLINDGVQAIPDEFLEWFVKNPSCEQVEIDKGYRGVDLFNYKIIIPKQETTLEEAEKEFEKLLNGKALPTKQLTEVAEHYFIIGYEIGQERMYSEEEVLKILLAKNADLGIIGKTSEVIEWFEQNKKK